MSSPDLSDLIGIPFESRGRGPLAYDCWGLVREVFTRFGIIIPDYNIAAEAVLAIDAAVRDVVSHAALGDGAWICCNERTVPAVVLCRNAACDPRIANHVGVNLGAGRWIHATRDAGVVISRLDDPLWRLRIEGFYRYDG